MKLSIFLALLVMTGWISYQDGKQNGSIDTPRFTQWAFMSGQSPFYFTANAGEIVYHSKNGHWYLHDINIDEETGEIGPNCEVRKK